MNPSPEECGPMLETEETSSYFLISFGVLGLLFSHLPTGSGDGRTLLSDVQGGIILLSGAGVILLTETGGGGTLLTDTGGGITLGSLITG